MSDTINTRDYGDELIETLLDLSCFVYTGKFIADTEPENRNIVIQGSAIRILEYIQDYIEKKYGKKDAIRSLSSAKFSDNELKWPYITEHAIEAAESLKDEMRKTFEKQIKLQS